MADIQRSIELMQSCGMTVRVLGESSGPFREYYVEDEAYMTEMAAVPGAYTIVDGVHYERLIVFEACLPNRRHLEIGFRQSGSATPIPRATPASS